MESIAKTEFENRYFQVRVEDNIRFSHSKLQMKYGIDDLYDPVRNQLGEVPLSHSRLTCNHLVDIYSRGHRFQFTHINDVRFAHDIVNMYIDFLKELPTSPDINIVIDKCSRFNVAIGASVDAQLRIIAKDRKEDELKKQSVPGSPQQAALLLSIMRGEF